MSSKIDKSMIPKGDEIPVSAADPTSIADAISAIAAGVGDLSVDAESLTQDGYVKLSNGLIIQWGHSTTTGDTRSVTFPIAFPNACFAVIPGATDASRWIGSLSSSSTGFSFRLWLSSGTGTEERTITWIALGM